MIMGSLRVVPLIAAAVIGLSANVIAGEAPYKPAQFDLSGLPSYTPQEKVIGTVRIWGAPVENLVGRWAYEFRQKQGTTRLSAYLINTSQAFAGLLTEKADVGIMGHRMWHTGLMAFRKSFGYDPLEIRFANG